MFSYLLRNVVYFASGSIGISLGLIPLVLIAVAIALLVSRTDFELSLPLEDDSANDLANGMLSLLVAFLVSKNIDVSMSILGAVDSVRTTAVELASLAHTLVGSECRDEISEINDAALMFLDTVLTEKTATGSVDDALKLTLRAVYRLKTSKAIEPAVVPVFVKAANACYLAHSNLWTLRELSGTPPSIKLTVYVIALFNVVFTISGMEASERTRVGAACFVAIASIGAYSISSIVRDPLYYKLTSGKARRMVAESRDTVVSIGSGCMEGGPVGASFGRKFSFQLLS